MDAVTLAAANASARKRFAPIGQAGLGNHVAFLGDSLTAGAIDNANRAFGFAWPLAACALTGGVLRPILTDGFPGQRSDQILPYLTSDILPAKPHTCVVAWGTNDINQSVALSVPQANTRTAVTALKAAGIQPVLATVPPNSTTTLHTAIATYNAWLKRYAVAQRVPLLDFHSVLVDPTSGDYATPYRNDGTHPNAAGYLAMAQLAANVLQPLSPNVPPLLTSRASDPINRLGANTLFLTDANADGVPDGWTSYGGGTGYTYSIVTGDTSILGNWAQIACTASTADRVLEYNVSSGFAAGDVLLVSGRFGISGYSSGSGLTVKVTMTGGAQNAYPLSSWKANMTGVYHQLLTVPAGTTAVLFDVIAGAGTGTYKVAQPTIYNLTALGLLNP